MCHLLKEPAVWLVETAMPRWTAHALLAGASVQYNRLLRVALSCQC